jgi:RNA polymerase sigma-70 factor, ECF subfamily
MAFSHLNQYRGTARFKAWLCAITMNEVLQSVRGRQTVSPQPLPESVAADLSDPWISPHVQCEQQERRRQLHRALVRLPEKYRLMIQLRDLREYSIAETARLLSLSSAAVRTRHHRARKMLLQSMMKQQGRTFESPTN